MTILFVFWMTVVLQGLIKQMAQIPQEENSTGFANCSSLWVKYFKLMVTSARFYTFFWGRSLVQVKYILFNLYCVFYNCILGCSIIFFNGGSYQLEINQLICFASWFLGFSAMRDISRGNFWTLCNIQWFFL